MKKVLVIGFLWPYIGGSKRTIGLAKYLKEFGWQPVILTPLSSAKPPSELWVVQTGYCGLLGKGARAFGLSDQSNLSDQLKAKVSGGSPAFKNILRWGYHILCEIAAYPDEHKKWRSHALAAAEDLISKVDVEALISVWPVSAHLVARDLKIKHNLPWIADLADLWSDNSGYPYSRLRKSFDKRLELCTLQDADVLTSSSRPLAERMSQLHGGRKVDAIMMGFDPEIVNQPPKRVRTPFTITYTGIFYKEKRNPFLFFKALQQVIEENRIDSNDLRVRFYGPQYDWVARQIKECGLSTVVQQCGQVSFDEVLERQRESHVLLQINWSDVNEKGVFSGKFMDYLAARRPILAAGGTGNDEEVIRILEETQAGVYAVTPDEIKSALKSFYQEYKETEMVGYRGDPHHVSIYSNRSMCEKFAELLNEISGAPLHR
jgi:hypothetical protein